jgi:DNA-binding beta-propeller fold protein YncE
MSQTVRPLLLACLAAVLLAGCAAPPPRPRILWPPPPETPRIEFIGAYRSQLDFEQTRGERFIRLLVGKMPEAAFQSPFGIAADGEGRVFIGDIHDHNVKIFDFNDKSVNFLSKTPLFETPLGMDRDRAGNLYVCDGAKGAVLVFDPQGQPLRSIGTKETIGKPAFLDLNEKLGRIYVSDGIGHRIVVYDLQGKHLFSFGGLGNDDGYFYSPQGVAIDSQGRVYVADHFNARIQYFDADGNFLGKFGERGDAVRQFEGPKGLAFDSEDNLYVLDGRRTFVYVYAPDGDLRMTFGSEAPSQHPLGFAAPRGVFVDRNDRIYVTDLTNHRFVVWQYLSKGYLEKHPVTEEDMKRLQEAIEKSGEKKE